MTVYGISNMKDHIDMMSRNQPQIKSTGLRLYGPKGSSFPRLDEVWDVKILKVITLLQNKHDGLWDIMRDQDTCPIGQLLRLLHGHSSMDLSSKLDSFMQHVGPKGPSIWGKNKIARHDHWGLSFWIRQQLDSAGDKNEILNHSESAAFGRFGWAGKLLFFPMSISISKHHEDHCGSQPAKTSHFLTRPNRPQTLGFNLPDISLQTKWGGIKFWCQAQILAYAGSPAQILSSLVFGVGSEF